MMEVRQDAMRDTMPLLGYRLGLAALLHMVVAFTDSLEVFRAYWLAFEGIAAVVARGLALHTLRKLTQASDFCLCHGGRPLSASSAWTHTIVMRLRHEWNTIIGGSMCIGAEKHSERWTRATLPLASSATHHLANGVATARHLQSELFGNPPAHDRGSLDAEFRHGKVMLADRALALLLHFFRTVMQGLIAILRFFLWT